MHKYIKLAPNFHIFLNKIERFRTEFNLTFTAGGAYFEKKLQAGLSHLLEHCEVAEIKHFSREELNNLLFEKDIYRNASTYYLGKDITVSGHKSDTELMLDMILEFAFDAKISQEVLDLEKRIVLQEMAQRKGDPNYKLNRLYCNSLYSKGSKYLTEILGDENIISKTTLEDLYNLRKEILERSHFVLIAVGKDIDEKTLVDKCKTYISSSRLNSDKTKEIHFEPGNIIKKFKYKPIVSEFANENLGIDIFIPIKTNLQNRTIRSIFSEVLFFYPEGIFYKILREKLGLIYSLDYGFDESLNYLYISLMCDINNAQTIIDESLKILNNLEKYLTEEKLKVIKTLYIKRQELASDNPFNTVDFSANCLMNYGIVQDYEDYLKEIKEISLESILDFSNIIKDNLKEMKVVTVCKDKSIEILDLKY